MSPVMDMWNTRNEMLNALESAIKQETCGRLSRLSIDVFDGRVVVEACSTTYYAIQLALRAIHRCVVAFPHISPSKLTFHVNGHLFVLRDPYSTRRTVQATARDKPPFPSERLSSDLHDYELSATRQPKFTVEAR